MTLQTWIKQTGHKKVAQIIKVDPSTVSAWFTHRACPRPHVMQEINKLTRNKVSYKSMIETYTKANN